MITAASTASSRFFAVAGIAFAAALTCAPASAQGAGTGTEVYAPGRILVMPRAGLADNEFASVMKAHGAGQSRRIGRTGLRLVDLPAGAEKAVAARLARHPLIKFAEVDGVMAPSLVVNDPYLGSQWHLGKIGAPTAWDITLGSGVKVAILDTGVDGSHPDLASRMVPGWNFYSGNSDTSDVNGHGTIVAGAAAATGNNGLGVASVAGLAQIMPVRVADANAYAYWSTAAQGITWAADNGARVVNLSYGGAAKSSTIQSAATYLRGKGGLLVISAGNNGIDEGIAPTTTMIPVSATTSSDARASWSSYGSFVAVAAPGAGIYSTTRGGGYTSASGTSVAAPVTAGTIALMMAANPALGIADIESLLYKTAVDLGTAGRDIYFGHGRVAADAAVEAARNAVVAGPDITSPTVAIVAPLGSSQVSGVVPVDVGAADNVGVTSVVLKVNGATVATDTAGPFGFSWNTTGLPNGTAQLVAVAVDAAGNQRSSAPVAVTVYNAVDVQPPTVTIANPIGGAKVTGTVTISVNAADDRGGAQITQELYVDGELRATKTGPSLSWNWNTKKERFGSHTIEARARDLAGNTSQVSVSVIK